MQIAIVGLAASGKTTVFNTLTRGHAQTGGYGGLPPNVGVVKVPAGRIDPARGLERLDLEFILADLTLVDRRLERLTSSGRHGTPAEREANEREEVILRRLKTELEAGRPIRDAGLSDDEAKAVRGFRFLTEKPVLVLLNVGESQLGTADELVARIASGYEHQHVLVDHLSAKIEMELGEL